MKTFINAFFADESGASAAEYALILAIVGVAIGAAALTLGGEIKQAMTGAAQEIANCNESTSTSCTGTDLVAQ